jgi:anti-sigma factor RsiW
MDHAEATRRFAVEQYLLGELSEAEREEFEEHFFACEECAEALDTSAAFTANAKAVFRELAAFPRPEQAERARWRFWTGWGFAPAAALAGWAVAGLLAGYQIYANRTGSAQFVMTPAISVRAARAARPLTFSKQQGIISLTVVHEWDENYSSYQGELESGTDRKIVLSYKLAAVPDDLAIAVRPGSLGTGTFFLNLYGLREGSAEKTLLQRISFTLTE